MQDPDNRLPLEARLLLCAAACLAVAAGCALPAPTPDPAPQQAFVCSGMRVLPFRIDGATAGTFAVTPFSGYLTWAPTQDEAVERVAAELRHQWNATWSALPGDPSLPRTPGVRDVSCALLAGFSPSGTPLPGLAQRPR